MGMDNSTGLQALPGHRDPYDLHPQIEFTTAVILLIGAIVGLVSAGITFINAMVGAITKPKKPHNDVGQAWTFWAHTGFQNLSLPGHDKPLQGAGGKFPKVLAFGATGVYIGTNWDEKSYARKNGWNGLPVWAVDKNIRDQPAYVLLSFQTNDPMCVTELGISKDNDADPASHGAFNALTAKACAKEWYHSGSTKENDMDWGDGVDASIGMPCVWLGGKDSGSVQFHLPSHSLVQNPATVKRINATATTRHDHFCNSPAKMNFWDDKPGPGELRSRLNLKLDQLGDLKLEDTLEKAKKTKWHGEPDPGYIARRSMHQEILSVGHRKKAGLLARELCEHGTSWGPDWVNEAEGKFCDMETHTLWDVCDGNIRDHCFDMDLKDVVKGGVVKRSMPYASEVHYE